ncbi:unnamed protein product [Trichobilharzia szidati]|nr:unnamed protein product [Trichobilharzia szidati]
MWIPPVCDNPPPFKIEEELLPPTLGTSKSLTKTSSVSASSSSNSDHKENSQYQAANIRFQFYPVPVISGLLVFCLFYCERVAEIDLLLVDMCEMI